MNITRDEIISRTQCCMEELPPVWEGSLTQNEGVTINRYIDAKIGETLRIIALTAPPHLLWTEAYPNLPKPEKHQDGSGRITLDTEILRPVSLLMEGWQRPVTEFITINDPRYELQFNPFTRGGSAKPMAIWGTDSTGKQVIDYYSLPASYKRHHILELTCIAPPDENATSYNLAPVIIDALCYRCAAAVYDILGNHAMAEVMLTHTTL